MPVARAPRTALALVLPALLAVPLLVLGAGSAQADSAGAAGEVVPGWSSQAEAEPAGPSPVPAPGPVAVEPEPDPPSDPPSDPEPSGDPEPSADADPPGEPAAGPTPEPGADPSPDDDPAGGPVPSDGPPLSSTGPDLAPRPEPVAPLPDEDAEDGPGRVSARVWLDLDRSGTQNGGEPGLPAVPVRLVAGEGVASDEHGRTGGDGSVAFPDLAPGPYRLVVTPPAGLRATASSDGAGDPDVAVQVRGGSASAWLGLIGSSRLRADVRDPRGGAATTSARVRWAGSDGAFNTADDVQVTLAVVRRVLDVGGMPTGRYRVEQVGRTVLTSPVLLTAGGAATSVVAQGTAAPGGRSGPASVARTLPTPPRPPPWRRPSCVPSSRAPGAPPSPHRWRRPVRPTPARVGARGSPASPRSASSCWPPAVPCSG